MAAEVTVIELEEPAVNAPPASFTVMVWAAAVFNVTENVPVPFVRAELAGSTALLSELVKRTVPA